LFSAEPDNCAFGKFIFLRLVLDTHVVVAAFRSDRGASQRLLFAALDGEFVKLISVPLMLEYEAVLKRPEHLSAEGLATDQVDIVLDVLAADPSDEMVLETAVNGRADRLVTFNVKHFGEAAGRFGLHVSRPGANWKELRRVSHEKK
jgi:predicted nucleic acid-binding protein